MPAGQAAAHRRGQATGTRYGPQRTRAGGGSLPARGGGGAVLLRQNPPCLGAHLFARCFFVSADRDHRLIRKAVRGKRMPPLALPVPRAPRARSHKKYVRAWVPRALRYASPRRATPRDSSGHDSRGTPGRPGPCLAGKQGGRRRYGAGLASVALSDPAGVRILTGLRFLFILCWTALLVAVETPPDSAALPPPPPPVGRPHRTPPRPLTSP